MANVSPCIGKGKHADITEKFLGYFIQCTHSEKQKERNDECNKYFEDTVSHLNIFSPNRFFNHTKNYIVLYPFTLIKTKWHAILVNEFPEDTVVVMKQCALQEMSSSKDV